MRKEITRMIICLLALAGIAAAQNNVFEQVNYKGAFGATNWMEGWTAMDHYGILTPPAPASGTVVTVTDADIPAGATVYWSSENTYLLDGRVFVDPGATLIIEAGTVIKGKSGVGENSSALVVARGGKIYAEGTASRPIIFTGEDDDVTTPFDVPFDAVELWGGLIILGYAPINVPAGENYIEGIPDESRGLYGGNDPDDNSGILRYVSIRHGGTEIGEGNEINGLTMGGVGRGTTIEYVEVFSNKDDGFEWFGGTVDCKFLVSAFARDDAFDHDEGLNSRMQFLFAIQGETTGDYCGEHDGAPSSAVASEPVTRPVIYNATYLGSGVNNVKEGVGIFRLRENWGGKYKNSIFGDYNGFGVTIEDKYDPDCRDRLEAGELQLQNNIWFALGAGAEWTQIAKAGETWTSDYLANPANGNTSEDPLLRGISRNDDGGLDPRPQHDGPAFQDLADIPNDGFFDQVNYKGAFGVTNWMKGWTAMDHYGILADIDVSGAQEIRVTDADIPEGANVYWTANNTYILDGRIFVDPGATLNIEAGTVIKGKSGVGENSSAMVVARGGKVYAEGTGTHPIIFTGEDDDVTTPFDVPFDAVELWGGLIILGSAPLNVPAGENYIEGIPDEARGLYGGDDTYDCSGVMRYISVRHGGIEIGEGNEINGITMGGVGRGTTLDYAEVFSNKDDGFEWFGGTIDHKFLVSAFARDDSFDHDEGLQSRMQFLFAIQGETTGDYCGEHDGAPGSAVASEPVARPVIYNATYLGSGVSNATEGSGVLRLRENWGGMYKNSLFGDYDGFGVTVEDKYDPDCRDRLEAGELQLQSNIWFDLSTGTDWTEIAKSGETWTSAYLADPANGNTSENPLLRSISRTDDGGLDPRPDYTGPAYTGLADITTSVVEIRNPGSSVPESFSMSRNYPNPFNPVTHIDFALKARTKVTMEVFNMLGRKVATLVNEVKSPGSYTVTWDASDMNSGMYLCRMKTASNVMTSKMILLK